MTISNAWTQEEYIPMLPRLQHETMTISRTFKMNSMVKSCCTDSDVSWQLLLSGDSLLEMWGQFCFHLQYHILYWNYRAEFNFGGCSVDFPTSICSNDLSAFKFISFPVAFGLKLSLNSTWHVPVLSFILHSSLGRCLNISIPSNSPKENGEYHW